MIGAMFDPQLFVYWNGIAGRSTAKPRKSWAWPNRGWNMLATKAWLCNPLGITISATLVNSRSPRTMPR